MVKSVFGKVMWMGRTTSALVGLVVLFALAIGAANSALAHTTVDNKLFHLGHNNPVGRLSALTGTLTGALLKLDNNGAGPALQLEVAENGAPLKVNAAAGTATNLSADELDGMDSSDFYAAGSKVADATHAEQADSATNAQNAANADTLDNRDSDDFAAAAHDHDDRYFTETESDGRYLGKTQKAADADTLDGQDSPALLNGQLIDTRVGNIVGAPNNATGYINVLSNYTPPVNATAASFVRCAYDGSGAGQRLVIRAAQRSPSGSGGSVTIGGSFYLPVTTPGPNISVLNQNSDTFHLNAGQSYDFGVNVADTAPTPSGGSATDYCTATVLIFRR